MSYREWTPVKPATPAFGKTWIVEAAWAHPVWHSYVVFLYDLTTPVEGTTTAIYLEGATHEMLMFALDPSHPVDPPAHLLKPANHGYQFRAESNEAAAARVVSILQLIAEQKLSPDTDFRSVWDTLFLDGMSLHMKGGAA